MLHYTAPQSCSKNIQQRFFSIKIKGGTVLAKIKLKHLKALCRKKTNYAIKTSLRIFSSVLYKEIQLVF